MINSIWQKILALFGKKQITDEKLLESNSKQAKEYENTNGINFASIFANKLSNLAISDCNIDVKGDDKRSETLKLALKKLKKKLKKVVARELGTGGVLVVPFVANNKLYFDIVSQSRLCINKNYGDDIVDCTILTDTINKNYVTYKKWADYTLNDGNLTIKYKVTGNMDEIVPIESIPEWANIKDVTITNVTQMPFMYLKSPVDNRKESDEYGVPITYGCTKEISDIKVTLEQIIREYDLKEAFIGADSTMFGPNGLPNNGLYKKVNAGEDNFWEVFSPEIRDSSLYNKLMQQCALLEKQVGTSRGILTETQTQNATATEIKKSMKDTFDLVDDIREELNDGLEAYLYACEVLINYYNLAPIGQYELKVDWDYSLVEDTQQTFSQLIQGVNNGVIKKVELRQFIKPDETLEDAQKVIDEIEAAEPKVEDLIGE